MRFDLFVKLKHELSTTLYNIRSFLMWADARGSANVIYRFWRISL